MVCFSKGLHHQKTNNFFLSFYKCFLFYMTCKYDKALTKHDVDHSYSIHVFKNLKRLLSFQIQAFALLTYPCINKALFIS